MIAIANSAANLYVLEDEGDTWPDRPDEYDALVLPDLDEDCNPLPYEREVSAA